MPALFDCQKCGTPLLSSIDLSDPLFAHSSMEMTYLAMRGTGYALNVYRENGGCPICGCTSEDSIGIPPVEPRKMLKCTRRLTERETKFLKMHSTVHLSQDASMKQRVANSAEYALAHSALRHYVLGPGSSVLGHVIGLIGLLEPGLPSPAISHLCQIVESCVGKRISSSSIAVSAFEIRGGSCVVVTLPEPRDPGEAFMVGLATGVRVDELDKLTVSEIKEYPQFFTLEKTRVPANRPFPAMLCQWRSRNTDDYYDNSRKNYGWGPLPVVSDFVDCVERIMVSGIWKD